MKKVLVTCHMGRHHKKFGHYDIEMLIESGCEVHFAANFNLEIDKVSDDRIKLHQVDFSRNPLSLKNIKAFKQMKKILNENKYELIHCQSPVGGVVTRLAARKNRKNGTKVIYTAHGFHFYKGAPLLNWLLFYPIEKWLSKYTDTIITINEQDFEIAKKKFKQTNVEYIPGIGIVPEKFDIKCTLEEKNKLKKEFEIKDKDFVIVSVGELNENKNQIMQIKAIKLLNEKNVKLLIVGDGPKKSFLEQKIKEYNLTDKVKLLGFRNDVPKILKISNLVLSTSKREGLPVNIIEALYVGVPIIGTNCRGTKDLIQEGVNGYIVDIDDTKSLAKYISISISQKFGTIKEKDIYTVYNIRKKIKKIFFEKRVLHVLASNKYSGAENVVSTIIDSFKEEIDMAYCSPVGEIKHIIEEQNIKYFGINKFNKKELKKVIKDYNPDIIHAHDFKASILVSMLNYKGKIISHLHKNDPKMKKISIKSIVYCFVSKRFYKIVGTSLTILDEYIFKNTIKNKYHVLYNYVDKEKIKKLSKEYKLEKKYNLCYIGRLSPEKNPLMFIEILNEINKYKKTTAVIVGDGILKEECIKKINEYKLNNLVDLVGFKKNPYPYIINSNICIMPSNFEGFGIVAIESMILNKPVLNSGVGGLKEIFKNKEYYICNNIDEYTNKIKELANKTEDLNSLIENFTDEDTWMNNIRNYYV